MNITKVTTQGTISIPIALRRKFGVKPGDTLAVFDRQGEIVITMTPDITAVREMNKKYLKNNIKPYKSGDGFRAHVKAKYGAK